jgi:hypothetical protein
MAFNRCFDTYILKQSSSDYTNSSRQTTIFKEVNNNVINLGNANPKKKNGFRYNSNFGVRTNDNTNTGCLSFSKNHDLLLDISKGKTIVNNKCPVVQPGISKMNAPIYDSFSGNFYSVNYPEGSTIATYDPSYCVINVDPNHILFYDSCSLTNKSGFPPQWFPTVDISFNNTNYYKEANQSQIYHGLHFPETVTFGST